MTATSLAMSLGPDRRRFRLWRTLSLVTGVETLLVVPAWLTVTMNVEVGGWAQ